MSSASLSRATTRAGSGGRSAALLTATLLMAVLLPREPVQAAPSLEETQRLLDEATAEQTAGEERLQRLDDELARGEEELSRLEEELGTAQVAVEEARAEEVLAEERSDVAGERLERARIDLDEVQAQLAEHTSLMEQHAVRLYTGRAASSPSVSWLNGLMSSGSDDVMRRLPYLEVLVNRDTQLLEASRAAFEAERGARQRLVDAQTGAEQMERDAAAARERALALVAEQEEALAAAQRAQEGRAALLAEVQGDQEARAALIRRLEARTQGVHAQLQAGIGLGAEGWVGRLPSAGQQFGNAIVSASSSAGIDPRLLAAIAWTESNFRAGAISPAGAIGLCQLMPSTAASLGVNPYDPVQNLNGGARYIKQLLDRYPGEPELAIAAYNAGPGKVDSAGGIPNIPETQVYVTRVLGRYQQLQ